MPPPTLQQQHGDDGELFAEVVVVRHGESLWNASRIVQGQMDPELNETGRQQAVVVARRLSRETKPAAVYSSDLKRAAETAQTIAEACDVQKLVLNEGLREMHMGNVQGMKLDDASVQNPGPFDRDQEIPGGGESLNQLSERCVSCLNKIAQQHIGERVIVVSHRGVIVELCRYTDPPGSSVRRNIPNTSLNVFHVSGVTGQWVLVRVGDVGHLDRNGALEHAFGGDRVSA